MNDKLYSTSTINNEKQTSAAKLYLKEENLTRIQVKLHGIIKYNPNVGSKAFQVSIRRSMTICRIIFYFHDRSINDKEIQN
ncbi:unnamed protein product [Rotaria sordida]|uniref:Uncharacterized protein n=1 Tax=Rotaria sordida TaxID=392033 RepID=A0A815HTZ8_9BILA|nr:unnamed protein product [Rotaria sordida]